MSSDVSGFDCEIADPGVACPKTVVVCWVVPTPRTSTANKTRAVETSADNRALATRRFIDQASQSLIRGL
jgi:hypothetical protein